MRPRPGSELVAVDEALQIRCSVWLHRGCLMERSIWAESRVKKEFGIFLTFRIWVPRSMSSERLSPRAAPAGAAAVGVAVMLLRAADRSAVVKAAAGAGASRGGDPGG